MLRAFDPRLLTLFLFADGLLIATHITYGLGVLSERVANWPDVLHIGRDWSAGEILNYAKWSLIILALFSIYRERRVPVALGLGTVFMICLLDDSLQLHERGSRWLVENTDLLGAFGTSQGMVGELIIWSGLGALAATCLLVGWFASERSERRRALPVLALFCGVVFCAVVLDVLHQELTEAGGVLAGLLGILEDGGEMVFLTLLLAYICGRYGSDHLAFQSERRATTEP